MPINNKYIDCIYYVTKFLVNKIEVDNKTLLAQKIIVMKPQLISVIRNENEVNGEIPI